MRRIFLILAIAALMAAMMVASAMPALALPPGGLPAPACEKGVVHQPATPKKPDAPTCGWYD